jgi:hypothetical protein
LRKICGELLHALLASEELISRTPRSVPAFFKNDEGRPTRRSQSLAPRSRAWTYGRHPASRTKRNRLKYVPAIVQEVFKLAKLRIGFIAILMLSRDIKKVKFPSRDIEPPAKRKVRPRIAWE